MKKITILICLVIILNAPISAYAQATSTIPTVTIAAGTGAAVGGAYQGYTSKTAAAATALTLAVLSATGAAVKLTEASVQAGKTVYQVINDKFAQWVGGTSAEELTPSQAEELQSRFKVITGGGGNSEDPDDNQNNGVNVGEDGKLWFSPGSLSMLKRFTDWLESSNQINEYVEHTGLYNTYFGNHVLYQSDNRFYVEAFEDYGGPLIDSYFGQFKDSANSDRYMIFVFNTRSIWCSSHYAGGSTGAGSSQVPNTNFWYSTPYNRYFSFTNTPVNGLVDISQFGLYGHDGIKQYLQSLQPAQQGVTEDGLYHGSNYNPDLIDNPNNQVFVVDPGILNGFNVDSDRQIAIPDYIDLIIQQAEEKAKKEAQPDPSPAPQELPVPLLDPITGTKSPANWIDPKPDDAIIDPIESEKRDPDPEDPKDPVIDDETPTDPEDAVELLKVDLTKIFPFCIPWDLYRILSKFNADPVTPSITIDWGNILGSVGVDFETTLDLHDYDGIAAVLRTMETVAFVVGLAVATRSIFLRS